MKLTPANPANSAISDHHLKSLPMKKILKWVGIVLGLLIILIAGTALYLNSAAKERLAKKHDITPKAIEIPTDSASIATGQKWVSILCSECHGADLAGTKFLDDPDMGTIYAPNLTPAGVGKSYTDLDWDRAIRHGVGHDKRPLIIMPSKDFKFMPDDQTAQIIAYLKTVPAAGEPLPLPKTTFLCNVLLQSGAFGDALSVETIDHNSPSHTAPARAVSVEYGNYLVKISGCKTCHNQQLNGGPNPDPEGPPGPNLTPGGNLPSWKAEGFVTTMRTGVTPFGKALDSKFMPWKAIGKYDDDQLQAIYAYLMSLPKLEMAEIK